MSKSSLRASSCSRILVFELWGCRSLDDLVYAAHVALASALLLSYGVRSGVCTWIIGRVGAKTYAIVLQGTPRRLYADYYAGTGLIERTIRRGRAGSLRLLTTVGSSPRCEYEVVLDSRWPPLSLAGLNDTRSLCVKLDCSSEDLYLLPYLAVAVDRVLGVGGAAR